MNQTFSRFLKYLQIASFPCFFAVLFMTSACNNDAKVKVSSPAFNSTDSTKPKFTQAMVDNKKDPSCGMPLSAGIGDTVYYKGKTYGFCSDECKQIFLKNPDSLSKLAELK